MESRPLAEVYDELKELRRVGGKLDAEIQWKRNPIGRSSTCTIWVRGKSYDFIIADFYRMIVGESSREDQSASLIRALEIKTLADRVFGDERKAEAWLERSNSSLSGQRPTDLLKDELGAAVVREMLERIDHGIFA
jgi:hypothetical protein